MDLAVEQEHHDESTPLWHDNVSGGAECKRRKGDIDMKNDETTRRHDEDDASIW